MEENWELDENKLNNKFVSKNDYVFRRQKKEKTKEELELDEKVRKAIDEVNKIDLKDINLFENIKINAEERKQINFDENLNIINDQSEDNIINDNIINTDDNNIINDNGDNQINTQKKKLSYKESMDILIASFPNETIQKFDYEKSNLTYEEKKKKAKDLAYQNVSKLYSVYKTVIFKTGKYFDYENTENLGNGFKVDGRDILNMSYVFALENPNLTHREYASFLINMYETFKHDYKNDPEIISEYYDEIKETITKKEVKEALSAYGNSLNDNDSESVKFKKGLASAAADGKIEVGKEDYVFNILKNNLDLNLNLPTKEELSKRKYMDSYIAKTLPTVRKYFDFENKIIDGYNFVDSTSVLEEQQLLSFALQDQAFFTKHKEYDEYLNSKDKDVEYYKEKDLQAYRKSETHINIVNEFKDYNIRGLSKETIGVQDGVHNDPLLDRFYIKKNTVPSYLAKSNEVFKLPVDDETYKYAKMIAGENKLSDKDKIKLYTYLQASGMYFEETNTSNTNAYATAGQYDLTWTDLIFIDGKSLKELNKGEVISIKNPDKKDKKGRIVEDTFTAETTSVKYLIDALVNKNQNVTIARLHESENELSVEVRPLYFEFNQEEYAKANKKTGLASLFSRTNIINKNEQQEALWNERSLNFAKEKEEISSILIKKVIDKEPTIVLKSGKMLAQDVLSYQQQKLMDLNYSKEEIGKIVFAHGIEKKDTIDLNLNLDESIDNSLVFDVDGKNLNDSNIIIDNEIIETEDINTEQVKPEEEIIRESVSVLDTINKPTKEELRKVEAEKKLEQQRAREAELHRENQQQLLDKINNTYPKHNNMVINADYLRLVDLHLDDEIYKDENIYANDSKFSLDKILSDIKIDLNSEIQVFDDNMNFNSEINKQCTILKNNKAYENAMANLDKLTTIFKYVHSKLKDIDENRFKSLTESNGVLNQLDARDVHTMSYIYALENPNMTIKQYAELVTSLFMVYTHDYRKDKETMKDYYTDLVEKITPDVKTQAEGLLARLHDEEKDATEGQLQNIKSKIESTEKFIKGDYNIENYGCVKYVLRALDIPYQSEENYVAGKKKDEFLNRVTPSVETLNNYCKNVMENLDNLDTNTTFDTQKVIVDYLQSQAKVTKYQEFYNLKDRTLKELKDDDILKYQEGLINQKIVKDMSVRGINTDLYTTCTIGKELNLGDPTTNRLYHFRNVVMDAVAKMEGNTLNLPLDEEIYKAAELINKADNRDISDKERDFVSNYISCFSFNFSALLCPNTNEYSTCSKFKLKPEDLIFLDGKPLMSYPTSEKEMDDLSAKTGIKFTHDKYRSYLLIKTICKYPKKINFVRLHSTNTKLQTEIIKIKPEVSQAKYLESNPQTRGIKERMRRLFKGVRDVEKINADVWKMTPEESKELNNKITSNIFKKLVTQKPKLRQIYNTNTISNDALNYQKQMLVKEVNMTNEQAKDFIKTHENGNLLDDNEIVDTIKVKDGLH